MTVKKIMYEQVQLYNIKDFSLTEENAVMRNFFQEIFWPNSGCQIYLKSPDFDVIFPVVVAIICSISARFILADMEFA